MNYINAMNILELENIQAAYNKREVLRGISITIKPGEIVSLIGPNGAGKSTLLKVIAGILSPSKGTVIFNGLNITNLSTYKRVREGIGYLIQGGQVFNRLSVKDNLELGGLSIRRNGLKEQIEDVLNIFPDLQRVLNNRAGLLSGGQREMLALGIILMQKPRILLLDEPSAGLAPNLVEVIIKKIAELREQYKITILIVEQNIKHSINISERILIMRQGRMIKEENASDLNLKMIEELFLS